MKTGRCSLIFVCLIAFSILLPAVPSFAVTSNLEVKCVDPSGKPIDNVKVVAYNLVTTREKDKKSDAQGIAEITKLDNGLYRIIGRKEGFVPAFYEYVRLNDSNGSITLTFAPGADRKLYFEDPVEDQKIREWIGQGMEAYKGGKFDDAVKLFGQALELHPFSPDALYYNGVALLQQAKFDQGVEYLKRAGAVSDTMVAASSADPKYAQISQAIQQLLKTMPAIKGESYLKQKKYDEAIASFLEAVKSDPSNPQFYANLAIAYTNAKRFDEAIPMIDKAIQLKPDEKAYTNLKNDINVRKENNALIQAQTIMDEGNKLLQEEDAAGAIRKYEEAMKMVTLPNQAPLWRQMGMANAKLNQHDAAVAAFKKSIEVAPAEEVSKYKTAFSNYYLQNKRYDEAIDLLADTKAGGQTSEQTLLDMAKARKDREPELAELILEKLLRMNPQNADAYYDLGRLYYIDGKSKDARTKELLTKYLEIGKDPVKIEDAKGLLVVVNKRSK